MFRARSDRYNPVDMGQFALGVRSLLVRATIFVVLAALLAWALGGTLFPRPQVADLRDHSAHYDGTQWYWRLLVGGRTKGEMRWLLMREASDGTAAVVVETEFSEVAGPVAGEDGVYFAGRSSDRWEVRRHGLAQETLERYSDRLAAEQQLARAAAGLPLQDAATVSRQRPRVLDPVEESADE